ncbi:MAG TPA: hypothetical protein VM934_09780 [Pyrinomonadaceae bacterium]|nr:hypothetical protein [Pyrinomonadaceae bacterium]
MSNPAVLKKVRSTLRLKNIFDTSLAEYRQDTWLDEFDYQVNYNKNYILDITFTQSGSAAYPDTHTRHFAINLKTGETIKAADAFNASSFTRLARMADEKLQAEIKTILKEAERDASEEDRKNNVDLFAPLKFTTKNLDEFSVGDRGITFLYDAGFPHVVQALQPEGRYFFSYAELKPFIKRNGVLAQFIR